MRKYVHSANARRDRCPFCTNGKTIPFCVASEHSGTRKTSLERFPIKYTQSGKLGERAMHIQRMKKGIRILVLCLVLFSIIGCTSSLPETTMQPSLEQPIVQTEQQILQEHPDNLDQALEELDTIE